MKRKRQVFISVVMYIIVLACALDFDFLKLVDLKLLLLVISGTVILSLPYYEKGIKRAEFTYIFGRKSIEAGIIQTFLLLFSMLQNETNAVRLPFEIAMCFRPLLYGFIILILFAERAEGEEKTEAAPEPVQKGNSVRHSGKETGSRQENIPASNAEFEINIADCGLTKREQEIVQLIRQGKSNGEIASELFISETTVKKHVSNIFEKTGVKRREELIVKGR